MKTIKALLFASITLAAMASCQRRHEYCMCHVPDGSGLQNFNPDWGMRTSFDNFTHDRQMCEAQKQKGYDWCSFSAE